jgi:hypothetical protein
LKDFPGKFKIKAIYGYVGYFHFNLGVEKIIHYFLISRKAV